MIRITLILVKQYTSQALSRTRKFGILGLLTQHHHNKENHHADTGVDQDNTHNSRITVTHPAASSQRRSACRLDRQQRTSRLVRRTRQGPVTRPPSQPRAHTLAVLKNKKGGVSFEEKGVNNKGGGAQYQQAPRTTSTSFMPHFIDDRLEHAGQETQGHTRNVRLQKKRNFTSLNSPRKHSKFHQ